MWEPYADAPDGSTPAAGEAVGQQAAAAAAPEVEVEHGTRMVSVEELYRLARGADAAGLTVAVHAIGDRAVDEVLGVFERVREANRPAHAAAASGEDGASLRVPVALLAVRWLQGRQRCGPDARWAPPLCAQGRGRCIAWSTCSTCRRRPRRARARRGRAWPPRPTRCTCSPTGSSCSGAWARTEPVRAAQAAPGASRPFGVVRVCCSPFWVGRGRALRCVSGCLHRACRRRAQLRVPVAGGAGRAAGPGERLARGGPAPPGQRGACLVHACERAPPTPTPTLPLTFWGAATRAGHGGTRAARSRSCAQFVSAFRRDWRSGPSKDRGAGGGGAGVPWSSSDGEALPVARALLGHTRAAARAALMADLVGTLRCAPPSSPSCPAAAWWSQPDAGRRIRRRYRGRGRACGGCREVLCVCTCGVARRAGMRADFVVLGSSPLEMRPGRPLPDVVEVYVDGRCAHGCSEPAGGAGE